MEWVETTAKTVEEAKELALDQLGVDADDAEFEVLEEPRPGLFGRVRGEARVRARVKPTRPRPKVERRDRRKRERDRDGRAEAATNASDKSAAPERGSTPSEPPVSDQPTSDAPRPSGRGGRGSDRGGDRSRADRSGGRGETSGPRPSAADVAIEAERFVGGLLDALGLEGTTRVAREGDELDVEIEGSNLGVLIGPRGSTLLAVQDLVRVASQRRIGDHDTRLRVDINGYREKRRAALARFALQQADEAVANGEARALEPMPSADRKVIHDALVGRTDVTTHSEGEDPARRVVIVPASVESADPSASSESADASGSSADASGSSDD